MSLYEISGAFAVALDALDEDEAGCITGWDEALLAEQAFNDKADNVACYIKNLDALTTAVKAEETALKKRRESLERRRDWLKSYLSSALLTAGLNKLETARNKLSFRRSTVVEITNEDALPDAYKNEKITVSPDKIMLKAALARGEAVPGAVIVERDNLQIK